MKTRRILAASTAALLSFASVAVVASAAIDADDPDAYEGFSKDGIETSDATLGCSALINGSDGLTVTATVKDVKKFEKYSMQIGLKDFDASADFSDTDALTGKQIAEIGKLTATKTTVLEVALAKEKNADGDLAVETKAPAPITFTISGLKEDVNVYHIGSKSIEKVTVTKDATIGSGKTATFTADSFSNFIITSEEIKKGLTAADDDDTSSDASDASSAATSDGTTSPDTGIALAIAPVVLAAGAVAVVALKKKH